MIVKKKILIEKECELTFTGATLLSYEDAINLPRKERIYNFSWWLRTPGYFSYIACIVFYSGDIHYGGDDVHNYYGIRPALQIANMGDFKVGDVFSIGKYCFKIISPKLAWLYKQDIGENYFDGKSNNYETSHIKQIVDAWFEKLKDETI